MSDSDFFRTPMGRTFYDSTMPRIAKALEAIVARLDTRSVAEELVTRIALMATTTEIAAVEGDVNPGGDDAIQFDAVIQAARDALRR